MWTYDYIYNDEDQAEQMLRTWMQAKQTRMLFSNQFFFFFFFASMYREWQTFKKKEKRHTFSMTVTTFCGCYIIGNCLLWADFGSQHYWLWLTPDARVGWAMSIERMELMSVPWGGCLSFGQGIVSRLTTSKIHQKLSVQQTTCSLKHIKHVDTSFSRCP